MKPLVYISSPFTKGDQILNARFQCQIFDRLVRDDIVTPIVPLWSAFQHIVIPREWEFWMKYDKEIILHCDALVRLNATHTFPDGTHYVQSESAGADEEVDWCHENNIPVFSSIASLYDWELSL